VLTKAALNNYNVHAFV